MDVHIYTHPHSALLLILLYSIMRIVKLTPNLQFPQSIRLANRCFLRHMLRICRIVKHHPRAEFAQVNSPGLGMDLKSQMIWFINSCIMSYYLIIVF